MSEDKVKRGQPAVAGDPGVEEPVAAPTEASAAPSSSLKAIFRDRRRLVATAAWMLALVVAFTAATLAWFSNSRETNVTPVAHTVSESGYDLQISSSANGPWDTTTTLAVADKTLYPISTADLSQWWRGTFQNAAGITMDYKNVTSRLDDDALTGTLYLKGSSAALNVYLYPGQMSISTDPQLLATLRLGLIVQTGAGTQTHIFTCDDLGSTGGATSQRTTAQDGVVVAGSGSWNYTADPSKSISSYAMDGNGDTPTARAGAQPICTLAANEVATVRYFIYMEGCDANCITQAQARDLTLQLAFAAAKA